MTSSIRAFAHTLETSAPPSAIWALWCDPASWGQWDGGLKSAMLLSNDFKVGAVGRITPRSGPPSAFTITAIDGHNRVVIETRLPFARLILDRSLNGSKPTSFTHRVAFAGAFGWFWACLLGPGFKRELPHTMARLARVAEADPS